MRPSRPRSSSTKCADGDTPRSHENTKWRDRLSWLTPMDSLFPDDRPPTATRAPAPLADRMRPRTFDEFVGLEELLAPGRPLREAIERDLLQSIILWGPPGTGKTTLARIIADMTRARFVAFSAVLSGIKEIREVMADAERQRR